MQPTDERSDSHIVIAVIYQGHLVLKTDVMFEALSGLHLDCEKVVNVLLYTHDAKRIDLEDRPHYFKVSE